MKHTILLTAALLISGQALMAQNKIVEGYRNEMKKYPPRIGFKVGPGISNLTVDDAGTINEKRAIPAGHAAIYLDMPLLPVFSIQAGVQVGSKGSKFTVGDAEGANYTEVRTVPVYVEIPVNAVIKIPLVNKVKLFAGAGPYLACGVAGTNKLEGKLLGVSFSDDKSIDFNSENNSSGFNSDLKRFDAGLNFLAGVEISHFTLNANYGYGLTNIKSGSDNNDSKYANRVASLSIGFIF